MTSQTPINTKFLLYLPPFGVGVGGTGGGVENSTYRNVNFTFLFDLYRHHMPILHRMATIHNAADRRLTDRQQQQQQHLGSSDPIVLGVDLQFL